MCSIHTKSTSHNLLISNVFPVYQSSPLAPLVVIEMVRKEDILEWFTQQSSHHRLDVLCTLTHLCLPFELRFFYTCVDYLARRVPPSGQDAESLAALEKSCCLQPGESLDLYNAPARRKLIWSLCLLQASSRAVANK